MPEHGAGQRLCHRADPRDRLRDPSLGDVVSLGVIDSGDDANEPDVDLLMASLRADSADASIYFGALCTKLVSALGPRASVSSEGRRSHRGRAPNRLKVLAGDDEFVALYDDGSIRCTVRHLVKGIALRTDELSLSTWLQELVKALGADAAESESTRIALERLLT